MGVYISGSDCLHPLNIRLSAQFTIFINDVCTATKQLHFCSDSVVRKICNFYHVLHPLNIRLPAQFILFLP